VISSCEPFVVLSTHSDKTIAPEHRVCSHGGMTHIASNVAWIIIVHNVIYLEYMLQKYLAKCELVTRLMCV
jgi:hypothetical protein